MGVGGMLWYVVLTLPWVSGTLALLFLAIVPSGILNVGFQTMVQGAPRPVARAGLGDTRVGGRVSDPAWVPARWHDGRGRQPSSHHGWGRRWTIHHFDSVRGCPVAAPALIGSERHPGRSPSVDCYLMRRSTDGNSGFRLRFYPASGEQDPVLMGHRSEELSRAGVLPAVITHQNKKIIAHSNEVRKPVSRPPRVDGCDCRRRNWRLWPGK